MACETTYKTNLEVSCKCGHVAAAHYDGRCCLCGCCEVSLNPINYAAAEKLAEDIRTYK